MDISRHDINALELFKVILDNGPTTLYAANTKSNMPIGTIHRHFMEMLKTEKIMVYDVAQSARKKISYGPTIYGFIYFYRLDDGLQKNLGSYFDRWSKSKHFVSDLKQAGFDERQLDRDTKSSKKIFERFVQFYAGVEDQLDFLVKNINEVPRDLRWFLGGFLLVRKKEYMRLYEELVRSMPGYRKDVSGILEGIINSYTKLKRLSS